MFICIYGLFCIVNSNVMFDFFFILFLHLNVGTVLTFEERSNRTPNILFDRKVLISDLCFYYKSKPYMYVCMGFKYVSYGQLIAKLLKMCLLTC